MAAWRLTVFAAVALICAASDLVVNATVSTPPWAHHERGIGWWGLSLVVLAGAAVIARSLPMSAAAAAGMLSGGVVANLISAGIDGAVPDPFVIGTVQGLAFNLADVFFLVGLTVLIAEVIGRMIQATRAGAASRIGTPGRSVRGS